MEDAFSKILNIFKKPDLGEDLLGAFCLGTVCNAEPLAIDVGGLRQSGADLGLNSDFLKKDKDGKFINPLLPGEKVLLAIMGGGQSFIAICKVVGA